VIITDKIAPRPVNNVSSFTVKAPLMDRGCPVFFLRFCQPFDTESLESGGFL
jgi:hypothetical protein